MAADDPTQAPRPHHSRPGPSAGTPPQPWGQNRHTLRAEPRGLQGYHRQDLPLPTSRQSCASTLQGRQDTMNPLQLTAVSGRLEVSERDEAFLAFQVRSQGKEMRLYNYRE